MSKIFKLSLITISTITLTMTNALAQSMYDLDYNYGNHSGAHYYDDSIDESSSYNGIQDVDEMGVLDNPKYISPQQVEDALKTYEKYGLSYKQRKKVEKRRKQRKEVEEGRMRFNPIYGSPHALFSLPVSVKIDEKILPAGFYLVDYKVTTENIIIYIKQGNSVLGVIPANKVLDQERKVMESFVEIDSIDEESVDITLNTKESRVQVTLPLYKPESSL